MEKWVFKEREKQEWIIITNKIYDINKYPNIKRHLLKYKNILDGRYRNFALKDADKEGRWWYLYGYRPNTNFEGKKIITPYRSVNNRFSYTDSSFYSSIDIFYINVKNDSYNLKYILAIINSSLILYWLKLNCKRKGIMLELYSTPLQTIPIMESKNQVPYITLVNRILTAKKANPQADTNALEAKIDRMVYDLYGLTDEEIAIVEDIVG